MREAAALTILPLLLKNGVTVKAHDPQSRRSGEDLLPGVLWQDNPLAAVTNADVTVILTEWPDYRSLEFHRIASLMRGDLLFDYRNLLNATDVTAAGLRYVSLGRPIRRPRKGAATAGDWHDIAAAPY